MYLKKIENIQSFRSMQISSHLQELFKNCRVKAKILVFPVPWLSLLRLFVNMNMGSYPQDLINIHFLKCICNNINLWKHYLPSICYIFMELSYTRHVYSICCSLLQNFLICIMLDSADCCLYSIIGTTPYVCVCSYNNHMYILKQCKWFLDCQISSMIKILIQVVSL